MRRFLRSGSVARNPHYAPGCTELAGGADFHYRPGMRSQSPQSCLLPGAKRRFRLQAAIRRHNKTPLGTLNCPVFQAS